MNEISSYFIIHRLNFREEESAFDSERRRIKAKINYTPVSELQNEDEKEKRRKYEREKKREQRLKKKEAQKSNQDVSSAYENLRQANIEELRLKFSQQNPGVKNPFQKN